MDRDQFQKMIKDKIEAAVNNTSKELKILADERICKAHDTLEQHRLTIAEILQTAIQQERNNLLQLLEQHRKQAEPNNTEAFLNQLQQAIESQQHTFDVLFTHPFFKRAPWDVEPKESTEKEDNSESSSSSA